MSNTRLEHDLVGAMEIPSNVYYGIHSLRAAQNFPITGQRLPGALIVRLAQIKRACAMANGEAGVLSAERAQAICRACDEIADGKLHDQFIVDPIQGGAGTSTNMNANEVIANRAIELMGGQMGEYALVHPNDHVNCAQSTNDVYPTAIRLALYDAAGPLLDALDELMAAFRERAEHFGDAVMIGRTQLQDAVPVRVSQVLDAYEAGIRRERARIAAARKELLCINLGGTAIGTGVNASLAYLRRVVPLLAQVTGLPVVRSADCVDATCNADTFVALSSALKSCAVTLSKLCNDLRLLSSGPEAGFGNFVLPARQNGSSIMPGKVNPVIPEVVNQIAFRVIGFDVTVTMAAEAGQLELNAFEPVMFDSLYQGCTQLCHGVQTLTQHCVRGLQINRERSLYQVEHTSSMATALCPQTGYAVACDMAVEARRTGRTIRELVSQRGMDVDSDALDPRTMTEMMETAQREA